MWTQESMNLCLRMDRDVSVFWRPLSNELGVCYIIRGWQWSTGPLVGWLMLVCQVGDTIASAGWRDGDWVWRFLRHPNYDSMAAMACRFPRGPLYINLWIADRHDRPSHPSQSREHISTDSNLCIAHRADTERWGQWSSMALSENSVLKDY